MNIIRTKYCPNFFSVNGLIEFVNVPKVFQIFFFKRVGKILVWNLQSIDGTEKNLDRNKAFSEFCSTLDFTCCVYILTDLK